MIGIGQMYRCNHKIASYGIQGYQIQKKYEDTNKILKQKNKTSEKQQSKHQPKRGHYLEDYAKIHNEIPGPGVYQYDIDTWKKSQKSSKKKIKPSKKLTYIQQLMEKQKKQNLPAPGQYQIFKTQQQINAQKKRLANRKVNVSQRLTYLDAVQYEASITPGVGFYNPTSFNRPKSATVLAKNRNTMPIGRPTTSKRRQSQPQIGSYNPKMIEDHKSFSRKSKGYHQWGRVERFKSEKKGVNLGPGAYIVDEKIVGKKNSKSVYYN